MKIELVPDGSPECPLLRIYDYDDTQLTSMRVMVEELSMSDEVSPPLTIIEAEEVGVSSLFIGMGAENGAFFNKESVRWVGDRDYWLEIAALMGEMGIISKHRNRYQWLSGPMAYYDSAGISVLLTEDEDGQW